MSGEFINLHALKQSWQAWISGNWLTALTSMQGNAGCGNKLTIIYQNFKGKEYFYKTRLKIVAPCCNWCKLKLSQ